MRRSAIFLGVLALVLAQRASAQDGRPTRDHGLRWGIAGGLVGRASIAGLADSPANVGPTVALSVQPSRGATLGWVGALGFAYFGSAASTTPSTPNMIANAPAAQILYGTLSAAWRPRLPAARGTALLAGIGEYHRWSSGSNSYGDAFGIHAGLVVPLAPRVSLDASVHRLLPGLRDVRWMYPVRLTIAL